nr:hypothetical protein [bacterium]
MRLQLLAFAMLLMFACSLTVRASALNPAETAQFDTALGLLGLGCDNLTLHNEAIALWGGDKYKLNVVDFLRADATRCGPYARSISNGLITNKDNLGNLVTSAHSRLDNGVRLGLVGDPLTAYRERIKELGPQCLSEALSEMTGDPATVYSTDPAYVALPQPVREAAALVLFTVPEAQRDRHEGMVAPMRKLDLEPAQVEARVVPFAINTFEEEDNMTGSEVVDDREDAQLVEQLLDSVDWNYINRASTLLAIVTQEAYKLLTPTDPAATHESLHGDYRFEVQTPLGIVRLSGTAGDVHPSGNYLLLLDTGGDE